MSELFSIQLQNRQQQGRDGVWLDLPTTTEQVQAALRQIGISSDNPQGLFISGYFAEEEKRIAIPYNMVLASNVDELNFLACQTSRHRPHRPGTDQPPGQPHPRGAGRKRGLCRLPALRAGHVRVFLWLCGRVEFGPGTGRVESLSGNYPQYGP